MKNNTGFSDFINRTPSQREVSLIVAKDDQELTTFQTILQNRGFRQTVGVHQLLTNITFPSKVFCIVNSSLPKEVYDFIVQYPTGQIEMFDKDRMIGKVTKPSYEDVSVVFILTKENLSNVQKNGYRLLENVGITYQN